MLNVAYIGFGNSVKRYHLPYVERRKDFINVKYIYRRAEDVEKEGSKEETWYPHIRFTTDIDEIMRDEEVNLVVINTPDRFHVHYSMMALENGKNVLCEKPFAETPEDAEKVFAFAREKGLIAMANQNRRFDADMRTMRKVLQSGVLGDILEVESHYDYFRPGLVTEMNLGFIWLKGLIVHPLDQMIGEFGKPERVVYDCRSLECPGEADEYCDLDLFYPNNLKVIIKSSQYVKIDSPRFTVHGKKGSFILYPLGHQSSEEKKEGPVNISFEPYPEETWGTVSYIDDDGNDITKKVPVEIGDYGIIYDNIHDMLENNAEKIVKDEQVVEVLKIIEKAQKIAKGIEL